MKMKISGRLECAKEMPALKHTTSDGDFNIEDSEVVKWLIKQPEVLQYIFTRISNNGTKPLIIYNPIKKTWQGVDYED